MSVSKPFLGIVYPNRVKMYRNLQPEVVFSLDLSGGNDHSNSLLYAYYIQIGLVVDKHKHNMVILRQLVIHVY